MARDKIYTIKIMQPGQNGVWYNNKVGRIFEAKLDFKLFNTHNLKGAVVFRVSEIHCVSQLDCKVINEAIIEN